MNHVAAVLVKWEIEENTISSLLGSPVILKILRMITVLAFNSLWAQLRNEPSVKFSCLRMLVGPLGKKWKLPLES